jgi:hypothetical protein
LAQYNALVNATSNASANTEDTFIELLPPSNVAIILKRVRVSLTGTPADNNTRVRVKRVSAAGATGTSGTAIRTRPAAPATVSTVTVKNGTTAFSVGTLVETVLDSAVNQRGIFEWVARDEDDYITSGINQRLAITVSSSAVSIVHTVECSWEE